MKRAYERQFVEVESSCFKESQQFWSCQYPENTTKLSNSGCLEPDDAWKTSYVYYRGQN